MNRLLANVVLLIRLKESPNCRQIGLEQSLLFGKLGSNKVCYSANCGCAPHQQFSFASPLTTASLVSSEFDMSVLFEVGMILFKFSRNFSSALCHIFLIREIAKLTKQIFAIKNLPHKFRSAPKCLSFLEVNIMCKRISSPEF